MFVSHLIIYQRVRRISPDSTSLLWSNFAQHLSKFHEWPFYVESFSFSTYRNISWLKRGMQARTLIGRLTDEENGMRTEETERKKGKDETSHGTKMCPLSLTGRWKGRRKEERRRAIVTWKPTMLRQNRQQAIIERRKGRTRERERGRK